MSIEKDPIANFYDAIRDMNYAQTIEVAQEIAGFLMCEADGVPAIEVAQALSDAANEKPTAKLPTRGAHD